MAGRSAGDISFEITGDTARLAAKIERDLTRAVSGVSRSIERNLSRSLSGIGPSVAPWRALSGSVATLNAETNKAAASFARLEAAKARALSAGSLPALTSQSRSALASVNSLGSSFDILNGKIGLLPIAVVGALTFGIKQAADEVFKLGQKIAEIGLSSASTLQNVELSIGAVSSELKDITADQAVAAMRELSVATGVPLKQISLAEQQFVLMGSTGKEALSTIKVEMDSLAAAGNLTGETFNYVSKALRQVGTKPFLQLEELNQLAEHIPVTRNKVVKQIAENTGDSIAEIQKRFKLGTQQGGDALTAIVQQLKALDVSGKALENRAKTLSGAWSIFKENARQALGDMFKPLADQLAGVLSSLNPRALAAQVGEPVRKAIAEMVPAIVQALPDIVSGIALSFRILAPIMAKTVQMAGALAGAIADHQAEIESAISSLSDFFGGISAVVSEVVPAFRPLLVQIDLTIKALGYIGQALEFISPVFSTVGKIGASMFTPLLNSIQLVLHAIEQLLEGIGLVPSSIPIFGSMADGADAAAAKIHNLRNELAGLGNQAATVKTGWEQDAGSITAELNKQGYFGNKTSGLDLNNLPLPKFANSGVAAPSAGASAAATKAKQLAKAYADSLKDVLKDLSEYSKNIGSKTMSQIKSSFERTLDALRESRDNAMAAGRKGTADAIQQQIKQFTKANQKLTALAKKRDAVNDKLKSAQDALKSLKDESASFVKSVTDSIKALGNVTTDTGGIRTTFIGIRRTLVGAVRDTKQFTAAITQLRSMGLNNTSLRQIVDAGPEQGLAAAKAIARRGQAGVSEINSLQKYLEDAGKDLATGLNNQFYTAGIQAANGLVVGLQSQEAQLVKAMDSLADKLVSAIKKKLKIASPSGVFEDEVGAMLPEGAARGIYKRMRVAENASKQLGNQTVINFGANAVAVHGVSDPNAAQKSGIYAGEGISDVVARRMARRQLAGEG